eukprot:1472727-Rhodomonas_salina.1
MQFVSAEVWLVSQRRKTPGGERPPDAVPLLVQRTPRPLETVPCHRTIYPCQYWAMQIYTHRGYWPTWQIRQHQLVIDHEQINRGCLAGPGSTMRYVSTGQCAGR